MSLGLDGRLCCKGEGRAYALNCSELMLLGVPAQTQAPRLNVPAAVQAMAPGSLHHLLCVQRQQPCAKCQA